MGTAPELTAKTGLNLDHGNILFWYKLNREANRLMGNFRGAKAHWHRLGLKDDMRRGALSPVDVRDRGLWRRIHGAKWRVNLDVP
jgi:hypothetical protein